MVPQFAFGSPWLEVAWAGGILVVFILAALIIVMGMKLMERRTQKRGRATLASRLFQSVSRPVFLLLVIEGIIMALNSSSYLVSWRPVLVKAGIAALIVLVTYALARSGSIVLSSYLRRTARRKARIDEGLVNFLRRIMTLVVYALGVLILLDYLDVTITPIVAGLGIGGLAVALALQPTLSNFFASTQIVSDRVVRTGDYIELDGSTIRGYVTDVGWRSTRIRTPYNNMVIIPNSRLVDSIITNYYGPTMEMGLIVNCGVSYSSDLARVEEVALEVAREVINDLDEAVKTFEPWFGYEEFGESNINFWLWLQATDRLASFRLKSELIKRLKARLDREGITINYPARILYWADDTKPPLPPEKPVDGKKESGDVEQIH